MRSSDLAQALLGGLAPAVSSVADPVAQWGLSGGMWLTGRPDGPPLVAGNGAAAVARTLLDALAATSLAGSLPLPGVSLLGERAAIAGLVRGGDRSAGGGTRLLRTADGHVALSLPRSSDAELVPALTCSDDAEADPWTQAASWAGQVTTDDVVERGRLLGLAVAGVAERRDPGHAAAVRFEPGGARDLRARPLVVDLSSLWAGPLCAHLLARAGADVVKVESLERPDGARRGPAAFFDLLHGRSRAVVGDFISAEGRRCLADLISRADVVLTSSRWRALEALGLDPYAAAAKGTTWVAITAHGLGRDADRIGFGDDVAVAAGLVGRDDRGPVFVGDAIADPLTGLAAAAATSAVLRTGSGGVLDVAMVRVAEVAARATLPGAYAVKVARPSARAAENPAPVLGAYDSLFLTGA